MHILSDKCAAHDYKFCFKLQNNILPKYFLNTNFLKLIIIFWINQHNNPAISECPQWNISSKEIELATDTQKYRILFHKISTQSFAGFKNNIKSKFIESYNVHYEIANC